MLRNLRTALPFLGLFILALPPVLVGGISLSSIIQGQPNGMVSPADVARHASYPWAVTLHILGGSAMLILGLTQFSATLRRRWPRVHRWLGRLLLILGAGFSLTALWMNRSPMRMADSALHDGAQNAAAVAFLVIATLGFLAARRRNWPAHRAWMMRAFALTMGSGTQTALLLPVFLVYGKVEGLAADLVFMGAWAVNLGLAEWVIRHPQRPSPARADRRTAPMQPVPVATAR